MCPTIRQKRVAKRMVEVINNGETITGGELLKSVGYGTGLQQGPSRVLESEGVKEALADYGFTEENAKSVVASLLMNEDIEPNARLKASDQVFKVHGSYAPEKNVNVNIELKDSPEIKELTQKLNEIYRGNGVPSDGGQSGSLGDKAPN